MVLLVVSLDVRSNWIQLLTQLHTDVPVFFGGGWMNGDVSGVLVVWLADGGVVADRERGGRLAEGP